MKIILKILCLFLIVSCGSHSYDCGFVIEKPYYLIQFESGEYGIMKSESGSGLKWYMLRDRRSHDFDVTLDDRTLRVGTECMARQALKDFLEERNLLKYKVISK